MGDIINDVHEWVGGFTKDAFGIDEPEPKKPPKIKKAEEKAEEKSDEESKKRRRRIASSGRSSTIKTRPTGLAGIPRAATTKKTLLGGS